MMKSYMKKVDERGFTLIELLVVIAIIGILSSVVLASLNGARESARDSRRQSDLQQIRTAASLYANTEGNGEYPSYAELEGSDAMSTVPTDPSDGSQYGYALDSGGFDLCVAALLEQENAEIDNNADCGASPDRSGDGTVYSIGI